MEIITTVKPNTLSDAFQKVFAGPIEVLALLFGTASVILNILILVALYMGSRRLTNYHRLVISLAVSDMLIGGSVLMLQTTGVYVLSMSSSATDHLCMIMIEIGFITTGFVSCLLHLMSMSIEHYMTVMKPVQYSTI